MTTIAKGPNKRRLAAKAKELGLQNWSIVRAKDCNGAPMFAFAKNGRFMPLYGLVAA